jgi:hypothetical protein
LNSEVQKRGQSDFSAFAEDDDDELEEETLLETPLDRIEPYQLFRNALLGGLNSDSTFIQYSQTACAGIQITQPQMYEALTKELTDDEKAMITSVFQEAEQKQLEEATALDLTNGN